MNEPTTPIESCEGSGKCQRCDGRGLHMRETYEDVECEVCDGTGECPCIFNVKAHKGKVR